MSRLLTAFAAVLALSCADDIILPEDPPIEGAYHGTYTVIKRYGTPPDTTLSSSIYWGFDGDIFWMKLDSQSTAGHCFCDCKGHFALGDLVRLEPSDWWIGTNACEACDELSTPQGSFKFVSRGDPLILKAIDVETNMMRELRLNRLADATDEP